jgi:predicted outer membrane repeat protein
MTRLQRLSVSVTTPVLLLIALVWLLAITPNTTFVASLSNLDRSSSAIKPVDSPAPQPPLKTANATQPIVQVLAPIQQTQKQDGGIIDCPAGANYGAPDNNSLGAWGQVHPNIGSAPYWGLQGIGWDAQIECAIFARFALPTLPPGAVLQSAQLAVAPVTAFFHDNNTGNEILSVRASRVLTSASYGWYPSGQLLTISEQDVIVSNNVALMKNDPSITPKYHVTKWDVTSIVNDWLLTPTLNFGVHLSALSPEAHYNRGVQIPDSFRWADADLNVDSAIFGNQDTDGAGIMLLIEYTAPTLLEGVPLDYDPDYEKAITLTTPTEGNRFLRTDHVYQLPSNGSEWLGVGVKGFQFGPYSKLLAADSPRLASACLGIGEPGIDLCTVEAAPVAGEANLLMFTGDPANHLPPVVAKVSTPSPETPNIENYAIEAVSSIALPAMTNAEGIPNSGYLTTTFTWSTQHILKVFDLPLNKDQNVKVTLTSAPNVPVRAYLFAPDDAYQSKSANGVLIADSVGSTGDYKTDAISGTFALALEYAGDVHTLGKVLAADAPDAVATDYPSTFSVTLQIRACPNYAVAVENGCVLMDKPASDTPTMTVGSYIIWSTADFIQRTDLCATNCYQTRARSPGDGKLHMAYLSWAADGTAPLRLMGVDQSIVFNNSTLDVSGLLTGNVRLVLDPAVMTITQQVWTGDFRAISGGASDGLIIPTGTIKLMNVPLIPTDNLSTSVKVDMRPIGLGQHAHYDAIITRAVEIDQTTVQSITYALSWDVQAEGYSGNNGGVGTGPFNVTVSQSTGPTQIDIASLEFYFDTATWNIAYQPAENKNNPGTFTDLRVSGKLAQPDNMGGAWKPNVVLIHNSRSKDGPGGSQPSCHGHCLELRGEGDTATNSVTTWKMPDVNVSGSGATQVMVMSSKGGLRAQDVSVPFSFRTFGGEVKLSQGKCPASLSDAGSSEEVTIIEGSTTIALPGSDPEDSGGQSINAHFILCKNKLRQVSLTFETTPGIAVGATGLLLTYVKGTVTIDPAKTLIEIEVRFHDVNNSLIEAAGKVTIDTSGLFDLKTGGKLVKQVGVDAHVWVAWNPLDIGVDAGACWPDSDPTYNLSHCREDEDDWAILATIHAHLWKGQGWQHKYYWLPDDNSQMHYAASGETTLRIPKAVISPLGIDIPPNPIKLQSIKIAVGQFCTNENGCLPLEDAASASFSILSFDVGVYYGFDTGASFIFGSDDHLLADQYAAPGGGSLAPIDPKHLTAKRPSSNFDSWPLTVTAQTGSFLVGFRWDHKLPALTLRDPNNNVVVLSSDIQLTATDHITLYTVRNPMVGIWHAEISNGAESNYHLVYYSNKKMPSMALTAPATQNIIPATSTYKIQWSVPSYSIPLSISLYYSMTDAATQTTTQTYGGMIRENLPVTLGAYDWDLSYLGTGNYHIYALVNDGIRISPTITSTNRLPGILTLIAPGTVRYTDTLAPSVPENQFKYTPMNDQLRMCWTPSPAHDLSGYLIHYQSLTAIGSTRNHTLRLHATVPYTPSTIEQQCARISGLNSGTNFTFTGQLAAYDASGNVSAYSPYLSITLPSGLPSSLPTPIGLTATLGLNHSAVLTWTSIGVSGARYRIYYATNTPAGPGQPANGSIEGPSPVDAGPIVTLTLNGLKPGCMQHFVAQAYTNGITNSMNSGISSDVALLLSDGVDADNNGLPDDWSACYGLGGDPNADTDHDGCTDLEEFAIKSDPTRIDTDYDGYGDCEEKVGGSDPLDPHSLPSNLTKLPKLVLDKHHLGFHFYSSDPATLTDTVGITNAGGGTLTPTFSTDASWLSANVVGNNVVVQVDRSALLSGHYIGTVTVNGGAHVQNSPQYVSIDLWTTGDVLYVAPSANCNGQTPCYATVQDAVNAATLASEIHVAAGVYNDLHTTYVYNDLNTTNTITQVVYIAKPVKVIGGYTIADWSTPPDPVLRPTVLDAQRNGRVLVFTSTIAAVVDGFQLINGSATDQHGGQSTIYYLGPYVDVGGGVYVYSTTTAIIRNSVISNSLAYYSFVEGGGGLYNLGQTTLDHVSVISNTTYGTGGERGGGIYNRGTLIMKSSDIISNSAIAYGGGLYNLGTATIEQATISGNRVYGSSPNGGGLYNDGGTLLISDTLMTQNTSSGRGGNLYNYNGVAVLRNTISSYSDNYYGSLFNDHARMTLDNVQVINNSGGGVQNYISGVLTITNSIFSGNGGGYGGLGGLFIYYDASATTVSATSFISNVAYSGGGVDANGPITLTNVVFQFNQGGGLYTFANSAIDHATFYSNTGQYGYGGAWRNSGTAVANHLTVTHNTANYYFGGGSGGGIYNNGTLSLSNASILSNTADTSGGGLENSGGGGYGIATLSNVLIAGNAAYYSGGGGIYSFGGALTMTNSTVRDNQGLDPLGNSHGGGIRNNGWLSLDNVSVTGNHATGSGGGIYSEYVTQTLRNVTIMNNTADAGIGGGGLVKYLGGLSLDKVRIISNTASYYASGLFLLDANTTITNSVIADNHISGSTGSGIRIEHGTAQVVHSTIARNTGGDEHGIFIEGSINSGLTWAELTNTIIVGHGTGISNTGSLDDGYNSAILNGLLWFGNTKNTAGGGSITATNIYTGNPSFAADGYHLLGASAAIDRGVSTNVATDIDGDARPIGPLPDLGADEALSSTPPQPSVTLSGATIGVINSAYTFTTTVSPLTTPQPITYSWQATGQTAVTHTNGITDQVTFNWNSVGLKTMTVTVSNGAGTPITIGRSISIVAGAQIIINPIGVMTLTYTDTQNNPTIIVIPNGAVTQTTTLLLTPVPTITGASGFAFGGHAFTLDAYRDGVKLNGFVFQKPITITLHYSNADVAGLDETTLTMRYWNGSAWLDAATSCAPTSTYQRYPAQNYLTVNICHLSNFALLTPIKHYVYLPLVKR